MAEEKKIKRVLRVGRDLESGLSSFIERPVPTEKEVASFEKVVKREVREHEIDSNLSEIYQDKKGEKVDVRKMIVKKRPLFVLRFFFKILAFVFLAIAGYLAYTYFGNSADVTSLEFSIIAPEKIIAGEEFSYLIEYKNPTKYNFSQLRLELQYPAGFIFSEGSIAPDSGNYGWDLDDLAPGAEGKLSVKGKLIGQSDSANIIFGHLVYYPGAFTSQYKKDSTASTIIEGPGFRVDLDASATAFLNQENEMTLIISDVQKNFLEDFNISFGLPAEANASVIIPESAATTSSQTATGTLKIEKSGGASWQVKNVSPEIGRQEIPLTYKVTQKSDDLEIKVRLEKKIADGQSYLFWEKVIKPELVTSDLNLTLFMNGSKNDGSASFGQRLNYSLTYSNKGSVSYKDVVIMAALKGDFLDWNSLDDQKKGAVGNKTLVWTKKEIPALSEIKPGQEGSIDFSIGLLPFDQTDFGKDMSVVAYGQYSMNNQAVKGENNRSNTINSRINSDISLTEKILYFDEDNRPVGSGPLPPAAGQKTSFKVYWTVKNNLHELTDTRVVFALPAGVSYDQNSSTNVGSVYFDEASRQVIWEIGRLPLSVLRADAQFNIALIPSESDRNKIMIISSGSTVSAMDTETKNLINKKIDSKTTKLEDDDIASLTNSGIIQ